MNQAWLTQAAPLAFFPSSRPCSAEQTCTQAVDGWAIAADPRTEIGRLVVVTAKGARSLVRDTFRE